MFIYQITNILNGHRYIGRTLQKPPKRFGVHKRNACSGLETHLYRAMRLYGVEQFMIEVIETVQDPDLLDLREQYWIDTLRPEYNMTAGGEGGDTSQSPNYRTGIERRQQERARSGWRPPNFGKFGSAHPCYGTKRTSEQKERVRQGVLKSWSDSKSRKDKLSLSMLGFNKAAASNAKPVVLNGQSYVSLAEASRQTGRSIFYIKKYGKLA